MLKGKNILIVGAAGLLGKELVKSCLEQNASVIAADVQQQDEAEWPSDCADRLTFLNVDISDERAVRSMFDIETNIHGVVNCSYPRNQAYGASFLDVKLMDFNENVNLHLGSAFLLLQQAVRYFEQKKHPMSIVNMSSIYGVVAPRFELYANTSMTMPVEYAAIKSAIIHLTKYLASYVKNSGFRVNCVSPGGIKNAQPDSFLKAYASETAGKGMLDRQDIMGSILFLLSDYSNYIRGQNIVVDDGFSL
jgi:NAD(P)-dependent dehydrogenase (short-subunit alcohol dehydrogenase family)